MAERTPRELTRQQAADVLALSPTASPREVERRFRRLALRHHPDRGGDAREFHRLCIARARLLDGDTPPAGSVRFYSARQALWASVWQYIVRQLPDRLGQRYRPPPRVR